ncbi:unnamed protein product [Schistosoma mattheei]|uniref:Uncharacterized protein n=1 Tax=Schistosoma mattheei TaxID=31246 RepID=A0A183PFA1_9TREM|nr:unnamed protein product [Schistosoma mattheei]
MPRCLLRQNHFVVEVACRRSICLILYKENHGPASEFVLPGHIRKLEDVLDRFCLSALNDENDSIPSVDNILDLYILEDWSYKLRRSDQRLRNISKKSEHDSSRNRILLISGQPGVGKTRFLTNWLNKRKSNGFTIMNDDIKVKELITITDADETTNNSLRTESDIIFIEEFIEPGKCNSDIWQLIDDLNRKARTARYKSGLHFSSNLCMLNYSEFSGS